MEAHRCSSGKHERLEEDVVFAVLCVGNNLLQLICLVLSFVLKDVWRTCIWWYQIVFQDLVI
jgi:hypothetical protein